jgi:hypothetical protein
LPEVDFQPGHLEPALQLEGEIRHVRQHRQKRETRTDGHTSVELRTLQRHLGRAPGYVAVDLFVEGRAVFPAYFGGLAGWDDDVETGQCA